jgi:hypothetical protein
MKKVSRFKYMWYMLIFKIKTKFFTKKKNKKKSGRYIY